MKTKEQIKDRIKELEEEYKVLLKSKEVTFTKIDKLFEIQHDIDTLRWVLK